MAESNFIDYVKIFCASGHGGAGSTHLHRAKYVAKGGPDGGDGGRGGHIILRANPQFWTLIHLKYRKVVRAEHGGAGSFALRKGKNGEDIYLVKIQVKTDDLDDVEKWLEGEEDAENEQVAGTNGSADSGDNTLPDDNISQYGGEDDGADA